MDGGVANNTPISHAIELGARRIYVLSTGQMCELDVVPHGALAMFIHATNLLVHRRLVDDIDRYHDDAVLIVLPPPCPIRVQPMDFSHAESLIEGALDEGRRFLDMYRRGNESMIQVRNWAWRAHIGHERPHAPPADPPPDVTSRRVARRQASGCGVRA